jgi:hypothetical protein
MYAKGQGVPQDYAEAAKWYRLAAAQGFAEAQDAIGLMYAYGQGVPQDYAEAAKWYRLAAAQGLAVTQMRIGFMYVIGQGVRRDYVPAHMWFTLAAAGSDQGIAREAREQRDNLAGMMTPEQIAKAQQLAREWKPTEPK